MWFSFKYDTKENDGALEQSQVSRAPPDYSNHLVRPSVCPSVRPS